MLRIIAGRHKNRMIPVLENADYRPSTTRLREAIFSILASGEFKERNFPVGMDVLDLFSGTGSLAFESLSRGARNATLIDIEANHLRVAREFAAKIGEADKAQFLQMDALNLPRADFQYDLVLMDPPYYKIQFLPVIQSLIAGNWLKNKAVIVLESAAKDVVVPLPLEEGNMKLIKQRIYGKNKIMFFEYEQN